MLYTIMHGKIHRATVTEANLEYMGSVTIDSELMEMAGILPGERVQIVDNNNATITARALKPTPLRVHRAAA